MTIVVGVSDAKVSANAGDVLATYSLGSCIGVSVHDPHVKVTGLLHFQLPSAGDPARAAQQPYMFADSGMSLLLNELAQLGAQPRRLRVRLAGAAKMFEDNGFFDIGRRNHAAIRKILWQRGMLVDSEHIGGTVPRTMFVKVADGSLVIRSYGREIAD